MKTFRSIAAIFVFSALFAVSAFAQTAATPKIGFVNTYAFGDDKAGITKYINANKTLETEFTPVNNELKTMATKYQTLQKDFENLRDAAQKPNSPVKVETVQAKADELDKLGREIKFKQEDAKAQFERRQAALLGPVQQDIMKAMQDFAKQKGYSVILDAAKLDEAGIILAWDPSADVTKEFVTFFNARPATTATTTK